MSTTPYNASQIEQQIDAILDCELNRLSVEKPAAAIANLPRKQQNIALHWITIGGKAHTEIGYKISQRISEALEYMDDETLEMWVKESMEKLDTEGLVPSVKSLDDVKTYAETAKERARGVTFEQVSRMLSLFLQGLSGRELRLEHNEFAWTDTATIYLPRYVGHFENQADNFRLYKSILAHQWAQLWYGTWKVELDPDNKPIPSFLTLLSQLDDSDAALTCLHRLEAIRLDYRISRDLPGIHRDMHYVLNLLDESLTPGGWEDHIDILRTPDATIADSCAVLMRIAQMNVVPEPISLQGCWQVDALRKALEKRMAAEKRELHKAVWKMAEEHERTEKAPTKSPEERKLKVKEIESASPNEAMKIEITLDDEPISLTIDVQNTLSSIIQDFGDLPEEYLQIGFAGAYDPNEDSSDKRDPWSGTYHEDDAFIYSEWDYQRQHYRKDWCVLRELAVKNGDPRFIDKTLNKYRKLVKHLHKSFEALRGEDKLLKQQVNGDDIDLEAYVEAWADSHCGMEMPDRLYTRMQRVERSIAVMFMVDMSGSTNGWINEAERESLILLCEALEKLGDRYAIYGFSGWARKRCEIFTVKTFDDSYNDEVKARIAGIEAQNYTRMGVAIRHLTRLLNQIDAKTRILVTLSDGRPEDYDEYRGAYGIEDTRMALVEARRSGIHPFCITIDKQGLEYLPHMYGPANYVVLDDVTKLPLKVADIYRKLTT